MSAISVLLITDDIPTSDIWRYFLNEKGVTTYIVSTLDEAQQALADKSVRMTLIHEHRGTSDGVALVRHLRAGCDLPILLLTTGDVNRAVQAYAAGVSECILEPVLPELLLAKVKVWLQNGALRQRLANAPLDFGKIRLDVERRAVLVEGRVVQLSELEFRLLHVLMSHPNQVVRSETLVERVWHSSPDLEGSTLKNTIYRLRRKLGADPDNPRFIQTITNEGYSFTP